MGLDIYFIHKSLKTLSTFRKVNFLVRFFESKGLDVEQQKPLTIKKAWCEELKNKCEQVLQDHSVAKELLPTRSGFFFGSTEYNDYYFQDVKEVKDFLESLIPSFDTLSDTEHIDFEIWY